MHWEIPSTFCLPAETSLMPVSPSICFRKWKFPEATFWVIKHREQSPFALTSQSREHRIRSHPKAMWSSLGSVISTLIKNVIWLSVSSINSKFFAGSLHDMISLLCPFLLPFGFCWNSTRILCVQIGSNQLGNFLRSWQSNMKKFHQFFKRPFYLLWIRGAVWQGVSRNFSIFLSRRKKSAASGFLRRLRL